MTLTIGDILNSLGIAQFSGDRSAQIRAVKIDSRQVGPNDLFVAIRGEHVDGHDFIPQALDAGACLCLSERPTALPRTLFCGDTTKALARLANGYRQKLKMPILAITGSSGKTTTKNLLKHVLSGFGKTEATLGNLNNHWGVPLTLLSFSEDAAFGIVEMGMNHAGEIAALCDIATPDIGLITNVGPAHIENFAGKIENVAKAKGELFARLQEHNVAIVNADDPLIAALPTQARRLAFGFSKSADVRAENLNVDNTSGSHFTIVTKDGACPAYLPLIGKHHVQNALGVVAIGIALGLDLQKMAARLADFKIEKGRGEFVPFFAGQIMDDTYNANPASMQAAFATLAAKFPNHKKIAVLGDMLELGETAAEWHRHVGEQAKQIGIHELYAFGPVSQNYLKGFGYAADEQKQRWFSSHNALSDALALKCKGQNAVALLIKGSRGMKMETVLQNLVKRT